MAAVQMNVRIDEETKARGDEVFARWGLTPSQVAVSYTHLDVYKRQEDGLVQQLQLPHPDVLRAA